MTTFYGYVVAKQDVSKLLVHTEGDCLKIKAWVEMLENLHLFQPSMHTQIQAVKQKEEDILPH